MLFSIILFLPSILAHGIQFSELDSLPVIYEDELPVHSSHIRRARAATTSNTNTSLAQFSIETVYHPTVQTLLGNEKNRDLIYFIAVARNFFKSALSVRPVAKISGSPRCGLNSTSKYSYVDFVLHVKLDTSPGETACDADTLAHAVACAQDRATGRPIGGKMVICSKKFLAKSDSDDHQWESTIKHEMTHALAFSSGLYGYYRNSTGQVYHGGSPSTYHLGSNLIFEIPNVVKNITRTWEVAGKTVSHTVWMIVTPKVTQAVRQHFNCPTLEGAELENHGGAGTSFTHWEKRVFENEAMTGSATQVYAFTNITLALFEDSGWYTVNYTMGEYMPWGRNLGCDFVKKSCLSWLNKGADSYPFCKASDSKIRCGQDRKAKVLCTMTQLSPSKQDYMYGLASFGSQLADYCPYFRVYSDITSGTEGKDTRCTYPYNKPSNFSLEVYSSNARCFEITDGIKVKGKGRTITHNEDVGCFETKCSNGTLWVKTAKSKFYPCNYAGQIVHVQKKIYDLGIVTFQIQCPDCKEICGASSCTPFTGDREERIGDRVSGAMTHFSLFVKGFLAVLMFI